jgi:hypothetical protein
MSSRRFPTLAFLAATLFLAGAGAHAQQLIIKGEFGLKGGTMGPPGLYTGMIGAFYWADELVLPDGTAVSGPTLDQIAFAPMLMYVSDFKLFGANYSAIAAVPFANVAIDFPRLDIGGETGVALAQLWIVPFSLGWHFKQADVTFHYAFYPPTGRYDVIQTPSGPSFAPNNTGLGMWCNEFSLRSTAYFDEAKRWHASASLFYDINGKKEDIDWKTGDPFTLMYGLGGNYGSGKSLFQGWGGVAGYAQWQVTDTTGSDVPSIVRENRTSVYGIGPEFTTLQGALTVRYFWQFGGKFTLRGPALYVQFVMPLPF